MRHIPIFYKFFSAFIFIGFVTVFTLSFWFYNSSKSALIDRTFEQLKSVNVLKKQQLQKISLHALPHTKEINEIMLETTGMGKSGETYLVDSHFKMQSISRFYPKNKIGELVVKTKASELGLRGISSWEILNDYRNVPVFSVYSSLNIHQIKYVIISEIDYEEAIKPVNDILQKIILASVLIFILLTLASLYVTNLVVKRIKLLETPINQLAKGQIPSQYLTVIEKDEIGHMMESVNALIKSFEKITVVAHEIGKGNLTYYFKPLSKDDSLSYSLLKMRHRLRELSEQEKTIQRQKTYFLLEGEERERKRLARELHDSLGQMLNGLRMRLDPIKDENQRIELKKITDDAILELKQIINNLMPTALTDFGLKAGLQILCNNFQNYDPIQIEFVYDDTNEEKQLPFEIAVFIYRITQEAINNTIKHAEASMIYVSVDKFADKICLFIKDNGHGFDTQNSHTGYGIKNIQERVLLLQGMIEISSSQNGTIINIEIPL